MNVYLQLTNILLFSFAIVLKNSLLVTQDNKLLYFIVTSYMLILNDIHFDPSLYLLCLL